MLRGTFSPGYLGEPRFLLKGRRIETCSTEDIDWTEDWINGLPRKGHGYRTPEELFEEQLDIIYRFSV